ncbi:MAG: hypothetical protein JKY65_03685 [Planctomycetes bacterium]|nr:hypothetical protein [Planctomycetota bacterium]
MSFVRGLVPVFAAALLSLPVLAQAGELDSCRLQTRGTGPMVAQADLGYEFEALADEVRLQSSEIDRLLLHEDVRLGLDTVPMGDLRNVEDFHPETDRWTEHNNRIRITWWTGAWLFSKELDLKNDLVTGFRIAWEVPGFIAIRWDSGFVPWSRLEVKQLQPAGNVSSREMSGMVSAHTLSLGIFNPELSVPDLAFWAGFGAGLWVYDYNESDIFSGSSSVDTADGDWSEINIGGNIFVELDYRIMDVFHVGIGIRQHFILADHTDDGRFYALDGVDQKGLGGRNDGIIDDLAGVTELTFNLSILF